MAELEDANVEVKVTGEIPPTQVVHSMQAVKRTFVQVLLPSLVVLVAVIPEIVAIIDAEAGNMLPTEFRVWMIGLATATAVLGSIVAKVMSLARVNELLHKINLAATPKNGRHEATAIIHMTPVTESPEIKD